MRKNILIVVLIVFILSACSTPTPPAPQPTATAAPTETEIPATPTATATPAPTEAPTLPAPTPTKIRPTFSGTACTDWSLIDKSDVGSQICVYGLVAAFAPDALQWSTIQFSEDPTAFRVQDFNYSYASYISVGDCVVIYGKIRDFGEYLMITPDFKTKGSVQTGPGEACG